MKVENNNNINNFSDLNFLNTYGEKVYSSNFPPARFGHTVNLVSQTTVLVFGGAISGTSNYTMTADLYLFNMSLNSWKKLEPDSNSITPNARAAHATATVRLNQMLVYGGSIGNGQYASEDLWFLDIKNNEKASWMKVPIDGSTPGLRYGHTMVYILPILILYGGSGKNEILNDVWILSTDKVPFKWESIKVIGNSNPRVYHTANLFKVQGSSEMMIVFGGRNKENVSVSEISGIKKNNNNDWEWVDFPKLGNNETQPLARHQHCATFFGPFLFVVGGRVSVREPASFDVYSMNKHKWYKFGNVALFRHSIWIYYSITSGDKYEVYMYIYGGFDGDNGSMINPDLYKINIVDLFSKIDSLHYELSDYMNQLLFYQVKIIEDVKNTKKNPHFTLHGKVVTYQLTETEENFGNMVKQFSLQKLKEESKKINNHNLFYKKIIYDEDLVSEFLYLLAFPETFTIKKPNELFFNFEKSKVMSLVKQAKQVFEPSNMVLHVKYPIKVFGNINGQYNDLMRYFTYFGRPSEYKGDIETFEYLFLGNLCSRGSHNLEVLCLLLALKLKYPEQLHIIRGCHDHKEFLKSTGLADECSNKLGDYPESDDSVFNAICDMFNYLPIAAIIKDSIFCAHSGIPENVTVESLNSIKKPYSPESNKLIADVLWSQPNILKENYTANNCTTIFRKLSFNQDNVNKFLSDNKLNLIIRSKDVVQHGFEKIFNSKVINIFSATNYLGQSNNNGAMIYVKKNLEIQPKVLTTDDNNLTWNNKGLSMFPESPRKKN